VGALAVKMMGGIQTTWGIDATFTALGFVSLALVVVAILFIYRTNPRSKEGAIS